MAAVPFEAVVGGYLAVYLGVIGLLEYYRRRDRPAATEEVDGQ